MEKYIQFFILFLLITSCQRETINQLDIQESVHDQTDNNLGSEQQDDIINQLTDCKRASKNQLEQVNQGFKKLDQFLSQCYTETSSKKWCDQVVRPNPESYSIFSCTYGTAQPHYFIHPNESTWKYAIQAVRLVQQLESNQIKVGIIYNWWRPEPYNKNVGGAAGRHPSGTSIDVRFVDKTEQNKAHTLLCQYRKQGHLRALGYYPGTGLHIGIGDSNANTWGKACI